MTNLFSKSNYVSFLLKRSYIITSLAVFAGIVSGVCSTFIIVLINKMLSNERSLNMTEPMMITWSFIGLCLISLITNLICEAVLIRLSHKSIFDLRMHIARQILATSLRRFEEIGITKIFVMITDDIRIISDALLAVPILCVNIAFAFASLIYLGWLSWIMLPPLLIVALLGVFIHQTLLRRSIKYLKLARDEQDTLFGHLRALTEGIKELKLHHYRRENFVQTLCTTAASQQRHYTTGMTIYALTNSFGRFLFFAAIGMLLFFLPILEVVNVHILTGYIITILYLMGPSETIMSLIPVLGRAKVAVEKVNALGLSLTPISKANNLTAKLDSDLTWTHLEIIDVTYTYNGEHSQGSFTLGPINLTLTPGELVLLVGSNGSGKTTLAKLLTGLYIPQSGGIYMDGQIITDKNREKYYQYFSSVFSDFYLFENLIGLSPQYIDNIDAKLQDYLVHLHLDHIVQAQNGVLSTSKLSHGQRKRLALLITYLEDRPIYVFDEWASDQDPEFKKLFYTQILPELKSKGKTILAISHDDRYFTIADRIVKLEHGKIIPSAAFQR